MHWRVLPSPWPCPCRTWPARRAGPSPRWGSGRSTGTPPSRARAAAWIALMRSQNSPQGGRSSRRLQPTVRRRAAAGSWPGRGGQRGQRLPPLRAGHAEVHRVVGGRAHADGDAVAQVDVERAAGRAEAAQVDAGGGGRRPEAAGTWPRPKPAGTTVEELAERRRRRLTGAIPGIRGATEARKNRRRSRQLGGDGHQRGEGEHDTRATQGRRRCSRSTAQAITAGRRRRAGRGRCGRAASGRRVPVSRARVRRGSRCPRSGPPRQERRGDADQRRRARRSTTSGSTAVGDAGRGVAAGGDHASGGDERAAAGGGRAARTGRS